MSNVHDISMTIHDFLSHLDLKARMSGVATLHLEFPDVSSMRCAEKVLWRELSSVNQPQQHTATWIDDHSMRFEPYAGVQIVITCKQRFATKFGESVGYRDIKLVEREGKP